MRTMRAFVAVGVCCSYAILQSVPASAQALERAVYASVLNAQGEPVEGLGTSAFVIREDGVAREVLRVVPASDPMQIALLVDNSAETERVITPLRQALTRFITAMTEPIEGGGMHELALITLASRPTIAVSYTTNRDTLLAAANRLFSQSNTATYALDGIFETSQGLTRRNAARPVIITITTEGPEYSTRRRDQVLSALDRTSATFHAIILGPSATDLSDEGRDRAEVLGRGPEDHGGHRDILLTAMALPDRLARLAAELRSQYHVTYARPRTLIPPDKVTVAAANPEFKAFGVPVSEPDSAGDR